MTERDDNVRQLHRYVPQPTGVDLLRDEAGNYAIKAVQESDPGIRRMMQEREREFDAIAAELEGLRAPVDPPERVEVGLGEGRTAVLCAYGEAGAVLCFRPVSEAHPVGDEVTEADGGADIGAPHEPRPGDVQIRMRTPKSYEVVRDTLDRVGRLHGWLVDPPEGRLIATVHVEGDDIVYRDPPERVSDRLAPCSMCGQLTTARAKPVERVSEASALREALEAIMREPHGCRFCDSGVLRNPSKDHDDGCGFSLARRALEDTKGEK